MAIDAAKVPCIRCEKGHLFLGAAVRQQVYQIFRADHLAVERAGNQRVLVYLTMLGVGDGHAIDLQSAAHRSFVRSLGFQKIGQRSQFRSLGADEVSLRQNHLVDSGSTELILLLLGVKCLLLELSLFASGFDLDTALLQRDERIADVHHREILELLHLRFDLPQLQDRALIGGLRRTVANRNLDVYTDQVVGKLVVKYLVLRGRKSRLGFPGDRDRRGRLKEAGNRIAVGIYDRGSGSSCWSSRYG